MWTHGLIGSRHRGSPWFKDWVSFQIESTFWFSEVKTFSTLKNCPLWFSHGKLLNWNHLPQGQRNAPNITKQQRAKEPVGKDRKDKLRSFLATLKKKKKKAWNWFILRSTFVFIKRYFVQIPSLLNIRPVSLLSSLYHAHHARMS